MMGLRTFLIALSSLLAMPLLAAESHVIGRVYDIAEPDALQEIQSRVSQIDWQKVMSEGVERNTAAQPVPLPGAKENRSRYHIPWYTTEFDVKDQTGAVIYPKGYRFNPLEHVRLPQRLVFIAEQDVPWAKNHLNTTDMVMITSGDYREIAVELERPVFILTEEVRDRMALQSVPAIVTQEGPTLRIEEHQRRL